MTAWKPGDRARITIPPFGAVRVNDDSWRVERSGRFCTDGWLSLMDATITPIVTEPPVGSLVWAHGTEWHRRDGWCEGTWFSTSGRVCTWTYVTKADDYRVLYTPDGAL